MEFETENPWKSVRIPLDASTEYIEIFVDEFPDDTTQLIDLLFDESVPPKYWIQIAAVYYSQKKYSQFLEIVNKILDENNYDKFKNDLEDKLVLMNYRIAYLLKTNTIKAEDYKQYDLDSNPLINWEGQNPSASATALALKCIYCLRNDDMKAAFSYMTYALNRDRSNLLAGLSAALFYVQSRDYEKALHSYHFILMAHPNCPASIRVGIAYCYHKLGNYKKAILAVDRALQIDAGNEEAYAMKACLLRSAPTMSVQERIQSSLQVAKQLYLINPHHPQILTEIGEHFFWTWNRVEGVVVSLKRGSNEVFYKGSIPESIKPNHLIRINDVYFRIRNTRDGVNDARLLLSQLYDGESIENGALYMNASTQTMEMCNESIKSSKISSIKSETLELMGRCFHMNNSWLKAKEMYEKAIHTNKKNVLALYGMAQV